jgi:hypothetical protein
MVDTYGLARILPLAGWMDGWWVLFGTGVMVRLVLIKCLSSFYLLILVLIIVNA